jgi:hypothetical protein
MKDNTVSLMSLSENVIEALKFHSKTTLPFFNVNTFKLPLVVGSGNAYNTGLIIFNKVSAIYSDESTFSQTLQSFSPIIKKKLIKDCVVISASGEKDSVWEIEAGKKAGLKTTLLTTKGRSNAAKIADTVYVYSSIAEPYTYNVSTYLGMILSATNENPRHILSFIKKIKLPVRFNHYSSYAFILPDTYIQICPMLDIKKSELFGPFISLRAFSQGHARHAKFVMRTNKELVISIGLENKYFGSPKHRYSIKLPKTADYGLMLSLTYYLVGKIQETKPQYYKKHIKNYVADYGPKAYGKKEPFELVVPGTV